MPQVSRKKIVLEVHGANLEWQTQKYQEKVNELREPLMKEGVVQWVGPYQPHELRNRMAGVDWVLIPSIWWENSPMVIQEAFVCGRPVICSDIGGMHEKVQPDVNGLHVQTGNPLAWGQTLLNASTSADMWDRLVAGIKPPITVADCADAHVNYF